MRYGDLYAAAALVVLAQVLGIYGLVSRKADLLLTVVMVALLAGGVALVLIGVSGIHGLP